MTHSIKQQIRDYLMNGGTLTQLEMMQEFNTTAGQQRVNELRREGDPIDADWTDLPSGKKVLTYFWRVPFSW